MIGRPLHHLTAAALLLASAVPAAAADRVELTNGRSLLGEIVERDDAGLWIRTDAGRVHVAEREIASVESVPEPDPAPRGTKAQAQEAAREEAQADARPEAPSRVRPERLTQEELLEAEFTEILLAGLDSEDPDERTQAKDKILALWPETAPVLDAALEHASQQVRKEAVRVLADERIEDPAVRLVGCFLDRSPTVQLLAVRVVRNRRIARVEPALVGLLGKVRPWSVHQEVLRTLEEIGTVRSLRAVLDGLEEHAEDAPRRSRFERVLGAVLDVDHGDDVEAWRRAVEAAIAQAAQTSREPAPAADEERSQADRAPE